MGKHASRRGVVGGKHVAAGRSTHVVGNRGLLAAGTAVGVAAVFGANLISSAIADNSPPVAPGTNLENIDVTVSSGHTVYARNASLSLVTTSDQSLVSVGSTVAFTYTLKNTGQTDFTNVRISDVGCSHIVGPTGNDTDPLLNIGETWTYTCSTVLMADQTNLATVTATPILTTVAPRPSVTPTATPTATPSPSPTTSATAAPSASPTPTSTIVNGVTLVNGVPVSVDPSLSPAVILAPGQSWYLSCGAGVSNGTDGYQVYTDNGACFDGGFVLIWATPGATAVSSSPSPTTSPTAAPTPTSTPTVVPPTPTPTIAPTPTPTVTVTVTPTPTPTVVTPTPTVAPTPTTPASTIVDGVYTGTSVVVNVPGEGIKGNLQVVATITAGKISAITIPVSPNVDGTSVRLFAQAKPVLISEAITANSANVASFSGATYTSAAFKTSLQSALTMAGY